MERDSWDDLRKRKDSDGIQMFTMAKKVDEAFQVSENEVYACREKHEIIQAEALKWEMETFHRRRILCMVEMFSKIDCSILFPGCIELNRLFYGELLFLSENRSVVGRTYGRDNYD